MPQKMIKFNKYKHKKLLGLHKALWSLFIIEIIFIKKLKMTNTTSEIEIQKIYLKTYNTILKKVFA